MFPAQYYYTVFVNVILLLSFIQYQETANVSVVGLLKAKRSIAGSMLLCILLIFIMGLRPISGYYFGDTSNYARTFARFESGSELYDPNASEWLFNLLISYCSKVMDVYSFFLIIEAFYIGLMFFACIRLMRNNAGIAMLFCLGAFSFFSYGVNGIRNGMACSIVLLAISYITGNTKDKIIAGGLSFLAYNIHHSTALPMICMLVSVFYRNTKVIYAFWMGSIVISVIAGGFVENIFSSLGFDDRLDHYLHNTEYDGQFSSTGFRWDFLLYSSMPIWLGWYVVIKRKVANTQYLLLLHTYVLANSFWVMLIRATFSNRFAYLSWFMYPIVLAYPLLKLPIWKDQGRKMGMILIAHFLFTYLMWIRG